MSYKLIEVLAVYNAGAVTEEHEFDAWDELIEHMSERASGMSEDEAEAYYNNSILMEEAE